MTHERVEKSIWLLGILTTLVVIWGGLVQIVPLLSDNKIRPPVGETFVKPYEPLRLAGFNIFIREGCYNCHSQMIRPFRWETERYGHFSLAEESQYDRPFQWGSKRTGPDLARVGGKYSDEWHKLHLTDPRSRVPTSNMPSFPWLAENPADVELTEKSILTKMRLGEPYIAENFPEAAGGATGDTELTHEQVQAWVKSQLDGKTELDAVVAYLQGLGRAFAENR
nr:cytochrome-c oxidase, cbb3-type subunit II [Suttonella ornithocola]